MARNERKRRTREHALAELCANHAERVALRCNLSALRIDDGAGITLALFTYTNDGTLEDGQVFLLAKGTDDSDALVQRGAINLPLDRAEVSLWLQEPMPCMVILYDSKADAAYWTYLQAQFENQQEPHFNDSDETLLVKIDRRHVMNEDAVLRFVRYRDGILSQVDRMIRHRA